VAIYAKAGLVHADFSEYNILVEHADRLVDTPAGVDFDPSEGPTARPRVIDVGQAVLTNHPMTREFVLRDAKNLTGYFKRQKVRVAPEDLTRLLRTT
jgi:RIO kinase 1